LTPGLVIEAISCRKWLWLNVLSWAALSQRS